MRSESTDIHDGPAVALAQQHTLVPSERDSPDSFARFRQLSNEPAGGAIPQLDLAVVTTSDHEAVIELETSDGIIVRAQTM